MTNATTLSSIPVPSLQTVLQDVNSSFERFCLTAGSSALDQMLVEEAEDLAGPRHRRGDGRCGLRWGRRKARSGFTAARRACGRPRVRSRLATRFNCPVGGPRMPRTGSGAGR